MQWKSGGSFTFLWVLLCVWSIMTSTVNARKHLGTKSLLTCMENSQFTASFFDVKFYPDENLIEFHIDATTTISEKIVVKAELITYGLKVLDRTFDLCTLKEVALCPLSSGRIDVNSTYTLDTDITKDIPGVAYTIPDLDAQVRVVAYSQSDTNFSKPLACVQAIVDNGKTVQTKYAAWPIAAVSGVGVLTSGFVSVIGYSATAAHIASNSISLFIYFQNLAITSMMGVSRVPPIAAAWTQNFQWSMGIIHAGFMQRAFDWYVQSTKGTSTVVNSNRNILSISIQKRSQEYARKLFKRISVASSRDYNFDKVLEDNAIYTTNERDPSVYSTKILVLRGIQRVAFLADIEISNFFLTGICFLLFFTFVVVIALIFFKALLELLTRSNTMSQTSNFFEYRQNWGSIIKGTLFRLAIIAFPQVTLLTIWEFTQRDSPAVVVDAAFMFIVITGILGYGTTRVFIKGRESLRLYKNPAYLLYSDTSFLNRYGFLYVQFRADKFWWLCPLLSYAFLRSLFVAVLQTKGKAQALIIFIIELLYFVGLCWIRPYLDKLTNVFNILIHLVTLINSLFFLFFSNLFHQPAIVSSVMAVILFVLNAVFALFLLLFTIVTCSLALLHRNPDIRYQPMKDDRVSFIPKLSRGADDMHLRNKSNAELFDLKQAVMDTNETEQEKLFREDTFLNPNAGKSSNRIFFDDEASTFSSSSLKNASSENSSQPLQPTSAVLGTGQQYLRGQAPYKNTEHLRKPQSSFQHHSNNSHFNQDTFL